MNKNEITGGGENELGNLVLFPTHNTPLISFHPNGDFWITGRSIPEDAFSYYDVIIDWIVRYCEIPAKSTTLIIMLEYINDGSMKFLAEIFRELSRIVDSDHNLSIDWHYESFDKDMEELGSLYSNIFGINMNFIPVEKD